MSPTPETIIIALQTEKMLSPERIKIETRKKLISFCVVHIFFYILFSVYNIQIVLI